MLRGTRPLYAYNLPTDAFNMTHKVSSSNGQRVTSLSRDVPILVVSVILLIRDFLYIPLIQT